MSSIHFIAIGGSVMHTLAIALHKKGDNITGSDDEIFEPSRSRLAAYNLLPESLGWFPEKITSKLDAVIVGMHARADNPELLKAQQLGLPIYSYPEFIYEIAKEKKRIVVAGSHGKTTTTAMILHALAFHQIPFDYVIGATPHGFETNVRLSDAPLIVIEGDEYTTSPTDLTPKFLHYHHHIAVITGIAWDHINVYPDFSTYLQQFSRLIQQTPKDGLLIYNQTDENVVNLLKEIKDVPQKPYCLHEHVVEKNITYLITPQNQKIRVNFFGAHNLQNVSAAKQVCMELNMQAEKFYEAIQLFQGTSKRLELLKTYGKTHLYRDFAHAPSKLTATIQAMKQQYPMQKLVAVFELHTYSSLNKSFLVYYANSMQDADTAIVYYNPKTLTLKRMEMISEEEIRRAFQRHDLLVFTDSTQLYNYLQNYSWGEDNLLMMSSGNFDNLDIQSIIK
ncbi:MAG: Mur ligase family protein [Cytophagales bacterium]|nr:Mur ligase family protein [Cytophagales bacterium]MDW8384541.1 Mur ligase family protein [Flammeovirgaceae bacterium]